MGRGVFTAAAPSLRDLDAYMPRSRWPWNREPSLIHADIRGTTPEGWAMAVYTVTCGPDTKCSNCGKVVCPGCRSYGRKPGHPGPGQAQQKTRRKDLLRQSTMPGGRQGHHPARSGVAWWTTFSWSSGWTRVRQLTCPGSRCWPSSAGG